MYILGYIYRTAHRISYLWPVLYVKVEVNIEVEFDTRSQLAPEPRFHSTADRSPLNRSPLNSSLQSA